MLLYKAGPQLLKVRFITVLSLLCEIGSLWWGIDLAQTYGLNPGDGGLLAPASARFAWAAGVIVPGIAFVVGMWFYSQHYIARLEYDERTRLFTVRHVWFPGSTTTVFRKEDILTSSFHKGKLNAHIQVKAPWWTIHIAGRRKPLILDAQGVVLEEEKMKKLFGR